MEFKKCRKKPIIVEFREPKEEIKVKLSDIVDKDDYTMAEMIETLEGILYAVKGRDFVIRGVKGELYPIEKGIFKETYDIV